MGLFDKLFGKKPVAPDSKPTATETVQLQTGDTLMAVGNHDAFKIIRPLTDEQKKAVEQSILFLRTGELYMHYWTDNLVATDRTDPEWQNKVMFFWKAEETFPKKSLPPVFESFTPKYFLFANVPPTVTMQSAQAMPWFGMPGMGTKHVCSINEEKVTVPEMHALGYVDYVEPVELSNDNMQALVDKENHFFLIDERITPFANGNFYLNEKPVPIDVAYSIGGLHLIKKTTLG